jgi:glycosyltransferase involved in cell wall biosynthesis
MKICYLCADLGISLARHNGASAHFRSLVRAFKALGHDLVVITPSVEGTEELGVPVVPIPAPRIVEPLLSEARRRVDEDGSTAAWDRLRVVRALGHVWNNVAVERVLGDVLPEHAPDLVFEVYSPFGVAGGVMARRLGARYVLNVHAPLAWEGTRYRRQALPEAAETLEELAFLTAPLVVTNSRELRDQLVDAGVRPGKVEVVVNGVDVDLFTEDGLARREGLDGKVVLGFVGSLKAWHGVDVLISAFRCLAEDPRFHLLVVGDGPLAKDLRALGEELPGRVSVVGAVPQDDVPAYVRAMDIAVAPYPPLDRFYFSPLKVLEYMAVGRAVVASRIGQNVDLIRDGQTGLLIPPGDAAALADAARELAADERLRRDLGAAAATETRASHTWKQRAAEIVELAEARG